MARGIILAGGKGTRLQPATFVMNKHMVPLLNKPMILYPLETLINLGIREIMVVTGGEHLGSIAAFLGDGSDYGVRLTYRVQMEASGIAAALNLARNFSNGERIAVILGDNFFADEVKITNIKGPTIFVKEVEDPERFGVFDPKSCSIIEKPKKPKSKLAVTGLYFYDSEVFDFIDTLKPSERGELEITSVNNWYLKRGKMEVVKLKRFWSDMGTPDSLMKTQSYIVMCNNISKKAKGRPVWNKGRAWTDDVKNKIRISNIGRKHLEETNKSKGFSKEKNPNWKGGISSEEKLIRTSRAYEEFRKAVFERDHYQCVLGGISHGNKLVADHINSFSEYPEERLLVSNGRTLCEECHRKTDNYGSKAWKKDKKSNSQLDK